MKIEHIALWVQDLEVMKSFYEKYFSGKAGQRYHNPQKNFTSYFISFEEGSRIELMHCPDIPPVPQKNEQQGFVHMAISVGSKEKVDELTEQIQKDGFQVIGKPRTTGDGYYESVVLDPEQNRIEVTV